MQQNIVCFQENIVYFAFSILEFTGTLIINGKFFSFVYWNDVWQWTDWIAVDRWSAWLYLSREHYG